MKRIFRTRDFQPDAERDLDEELECHLELRVEDLMKQGMSEEDAWAHVQETGDSTGPGENHGARQEHRAALRHTWARLRWEALSRWLDNLSGDLRYALRQVRQSPGFAVVAVLSLSLGIGANTAVFSVVNGLFLKPPPYAEPETLVTVWIGTGEGAPSSDVTWSEYVRLREVEGVFAGVGAYEGTITGLRDDQGTRSAMVETVTNNLFPLMGIEPVLGRSFLPDEGSVPGAGALAILGHEYWANAWDRDPGVLGETIYLSGIPFTVVGVAPPELPSLQARALVTQVFVPMSMGRALEGSDAPTGGRVDWPRAAKPMARLAPGVSMEVAEDRIAGIVEEVRVAEGRTTNRQWRFRLWPSAGLAIKPGIDTGLARVAWFVMAVAGMVLLLACTNLANLTLSRGMARRRELAVRSAIGAGRRRLVAQLLTETLVHSVAGGIGGFFLAQWTLDLLFRFQPNVGITFVLDMAPDLRVFFFSAGIVGLAVLLFGLLPALTVTRREIAPDLRGKDLPSWDRISRWRSGLVAFQMCVSVILLIGSSLFFHSLMEAQNSDPGFVAEGAVNLQVDLGRSQVPEEDRAAVMDELRREVSALPQVATLGMANVVPLLNRRVQWITVPGLAGPEGESPIDVSTYGVDEGYLDAMGIPVHTGRGLTGFDLQSSDRVVLVNQTGARRFWPEQSALGQEVQNGETTYRVVGVVGDVKVQWLSDAPEATLYFPLSDTSPIVHLVARSGTRDANGLISSIRRKVGKVDPDLLIVEAQTLKERVGINLFPFRLAAIYLGVFGAMALVLAAIGLYGVVSLSVAQRVREMGIRISIGADPRGVVGLILRKSMLPVTVGGMVGLALALGLATLIRGFLFGVEPADPATLAAVPTLLGLVALLATLLPALRAGRVDPMVTLRTE